MESNNVNKNENLVQRTRNIFEKHKSSSPVKNTHYHRSVSSVSNALFESVYMENGVFSSLENPEEHVNENSDASASNNSTKSRVKNMIKQFERQYSFDEKVSCHNENKEHKPLEKLDRKKERKKICSFVDAEDLEDTELYRKSLIGLMDSELAKMKLDGFLDNEENETDSPYESISFCAEATNDFPENVATSKQKIKDDFTESLGDDLENGSTVVEAYNDDGRELIVVEVVVDRRPVPLKQLDEAINEERKCSDFVLYENVDSTIKDVSTEEDDKRRNYLDKDSNIRTSSKNDATDTENYPNEYNDTVETGNNIISSVSAIPSIGSAVYSNIRVVTEGLEKIASRFSMKHKEEIKHNSNFVLYENCTWQAETENRVDVNNCDNMESPSNRSTMYSSTSRDSEDEDDEGISFDHVEIRNRKYDNARRETYSDSKGQVRIERIAKVERVMSIQDEKAPVSPSVSSMTPLTKLNYIMKEIKTTEKKYLEDLAKVVKVYRPFIIRHTTNSLVDSQRHLFGNIVDIYKKQKEFYQDLKDEEDIFGVVRSFIIHEALFQKYPTYFRNKPKADKVLKEFIPTIKQMQEQFEERLDFSAYLLTPVQRLGKYILFLENILSTLGKLDLPVGSTQMALDIVRKEMSKGNDFVAIESIQNSPISKIDYGTFKMREKFITLRPKRMEVVVFLFTNIIIITTSDPKEMETFNYFDSIKMVDLRIATYDDLTLHLTNFTKSKKKRNASRYTYVLEAKTDKLKALWREAIESLLWQQLYIAKEKSLKRSKSRESLSKSSKPRIKSTGSSTFYVDTN